MPSIVMNPSGTELGRCGRLRPSWHGAAFFAAALVATCWLGSVALLAQDWPMLRGPEGKGVIAPGGILTRSDSVGLQLAWKKQLGSGYSSVVVARNKLVTMCCDGQHDAIVCMRVSDGGTIWRSIVGPRYPGKNGSFDGPLSTPLIDGHRVFALSPRGKLVCLQMENGELVWTRNLPEAFGAPEPLYGFATSPILVDGVLVVQVGGDHQSALCGFDPATGQRLWSVGSDLIDSQSPAVATVGGRPVVLAAGRKFLLGVNPKNGELLFEHPHLGSNGTAMVPVPFGGEQVLLMPDDHYSTAVTLHPVGSRIYVQPFWKSRAIRNTYNVPVFVNQHLFGYSTRILVGIDPATGSTIWKSRDPGDGFLIGVDGHLIIATKQGSLHVAEAAPSGYQEKAALQVFQDLVWSLPAYSQDAVFVRSLGEIARVDLVAGKSVGSESVGSESVVSTGEPDALPLGPRFAELLKQISTSPDAQHKIKSFLAEHDRFPFIEDGIAHFVYYGEATDVAIAGDMFGGRQERKMVRVGDSNLHYYSLALPPDQRLNYIFLIDFQPVPDPLNPRTTTSTIYASEMEFAMRLFSEEPLTMSWFGMPAWEEPDYLANIDAADYQFAGRVEAFSLADGQESRDAVDGTESVGVYFPPGHRPNATEGYPLVVVVGGEPARQLVPIDRAVDNLFRQADQFGLPDQLPVVVFMGRGTPQRNKFLVEELIPELEERYGVRDGRTNRSLIANEFYAADGLRLLTTYPRQFSAISCQSPLIYEQVLSDAVDQLRAIDLPFRIYWEWGSLDLFNPHENWDIRSEARQAVELFQTVESLEVMGVLVNDSTDWSSWRNRLDQVFSFLLRDTQ